MKPATWKADGAIALAALIWGSTFVVVRAAIGQMSTMYFLALRFAFGSLCLALLFQGGLPQASSGRLWRGLRAGGLTGIVLWAGYAFQTEGLRFTTAGNSGFITGLYIVLVPIFSAAIYRRWPRWIELAGIAVATAGLVVLMLPSVSAHWQLNVGDVLTVGCAVAFACHLLLLGYFSRREHFESVVIGQIIAVALLSALALIWEPPAAHWSAPLLFAILGTGFFATALTFSLQTWGQRYTSSTRVALIFALEPVFALAFAVLAGGERLTWFSVAGGCLILGGIVAVELKPAVRE